MAMLGVLLVLAGCSRKEDAPGQNATTWTPPAFSASPHIESAGDSGTPASPSIGSFGVYAKHSVLLNASSVVTGCNVGVQLATGPYLSGGVSAYLNSSSSIQVTGTLYADSVFLNAGSTVGPVDTNHLTTNGGSTHGTVSPLPAMPAPPSPPPATAGSTSIIVNTGTRTLTPGAYGTVLVNGGATLTLTGGSYVFASLTLNGNSTLAASAASTLSITGTVVLNAGSYLGPASGSGLTARALALYLSTSQSVTLNANTSVRALVIATNAEVIVNTSQFRGAIAASQVLMNSGSVVTCEDGLGNPGCPASCDDGNPCTVDACAATACTHTAASNGTACSDGNACTQTDTCQAGTCTGGNPVTCANGNQCNGPGTCNAATGVCSAPVPKANGTTCNDSNACTQSDTCQAGTCTGASPVVCANGDQCNGPGTCNASTGGCSAPVPKANGTTCSDGNACTQSDSCQAGACTGSNPVTCSASDQCHSAGTCSPSTGQCSNPAKANGSLCSDGNACTQTDTCQAGVCAGANPMTCTNGDQCNGPGTCNAATGGCSAPVPKANGTTCNDGNACTRSDSCQAGACAGANPVTCTASDQCHAVGTCDASTGACSNPAKVDGSTCSDGNACTRSDSCVAGTCAGGGPVTCDDGNECTTDSCNADGSCSNAAVRFGTACGDTSNLCAGTSQCSIAGRCTLRLPPPVDDGNPCTVDTCDPSTGITHAPVVAGTACGDNSNLCLGRFACSAVGLCAQGPAPASDDSNPCTIDTCDPRTGPSHSPVAIGTACGDNSNACTGAFTCGASGQCAQGAPPSVDDGNACTTDACDPLHGVTHVPLASGSPCGSAPDACSGAFFCNSGTQCTQAAAPSFDDGNPCTIDACDVAHGVTHLPGAEGTSCGDNSDRCAGRASCTASGLCVRGSPPAVDDGNPCTTDACSPALGVSHAAVMPGTQCGAGVDACSGDLICDLSAHCVPGPEKSLDDGNQCTLDACDPVTGVTHTPTKAGVACGDDSNRCVGSATCDGAGTCTFTAGTSIDDGDPCTRDSCDPRTGVSHDALPLGTPCAPGGNKCGGQYLCQLSDTPMARRAGAINLSLASPALQCLLAPPPVVDDNNHCTTDLCDPATGAVSHLALASGTACSDGSDKCRAVSTCDPSGQCIAGQTIVDASDPCRIGACNPTTGAVTYTFADTSTPCADNTNRCQETFYCNGNGGCVPHPAPRPQSANPCIAGACDPQLGIVYGPAAAGTACSETDDDCTRPYSCDGQGSCVYGAVPAEGSPCGQDSEEGLTDLCGVHPICNQGVCNRLNYTANIRTNPFPWVAGDPYVDITPSFDQCVIGYRCDLFTGGITRLPDVVGTACGLFCAPAAACDSTGTCVATVGLDDGNPCTEDACNGSTGYAPVHTPRPAGSDCGPSTNRCRDARYTCDQNAVCVTQPPPDIDDQNPCTADSCDPSTGAVVHVAQPVGFNCSSDPDPCDGAPRKTCDAAGACVAQSALVVDDGNPCTNDVCDPNGARVEHVPAIGAPCGDASNHCAAASVCDGTGACVAGAAAVLDDHNPCTVDSCDPSTGPVHVVTPGAQCGAASGACTGRFACADNGACVQSASVAVDDGNPCTTDACDAATGNVSHVVVAGCIPPRWQTLAGRPSPRDSATIAFDPVKHGVVVFGGENAGVSLGDTWTWLRSVGVWSASYANGPPPRAAAAYAYDIARKKLVVFGGITRTSSGDTFRGDTWEYDSATSSWEERTPKSGNPPPRGYASCAYDAMRQRVVVVGGRGAGGAPDAGSSWEWDGVAGAWAPRSTTGDPPPRNSASLTYDSARSVLVLFGGQLTSATSSNPPVSETWELASASGAWTKRAAPTAPSPRVGHAMTFDSARGRVVLFAGTASATDTFQDTWEYDSSLGTWNAVASPEAPPARAGHTLAYDSELGRVVLLGGTGYSATGTTSPDLDDIWEYDGSTSRWMKRSAIAPALPTPGLVYDKSIQRLVVRGNEARPAMWELDPATISWTARDALAGQSDFGDDLLDSYRYYQLVYDDARGKLLHVSPGDAPPAKAPALWEWNRSQWTKRTCSNGPTAFHPDAAAYDTAASQLVLVGFGEHSLSETWLVDPAACVWARASDFPLARTSLSSAYDSLRQQVVVFSQASGSAGTFWGWDRTTMKWTTIAASGAPPSRPDAGFVFDPAHDRFVLFGGAASGSNGAPDAMNDTWTFDRAHGTWSNATPTLQPSPRRMASLAFDPSRGRVAMFGGVVLVGDKTVPMSDLWEWDGTDWQRRRALAGPTARSGAGAAWDSASHVGVLFGGTQGNGQRAFLQDTWLWRDGDWALASSFNPNNAPIEYPEAPGVLGNLQNNRWLNMAPATRTGHAMAAGAQKAVLFGGEGDTGILSDIWTFDLVSLKWTQQWGPLDAMTESAMVFAGTGDVGHFILFGGLDQYGRYRQDTYSDFTFLTPVGPSPRASHAMAFDSSRQVVVLYGGRDADGPKGDTWELSAANLGGGWVNKSPASAPPAMFGHRMYFDASRGRVVLVGGSTNGPELSSRDTWEWDGANWRKRGVGLADDPGRVGHVAFYDDSAGLGVVFGGMSYQSGGNATATYGDTVSFTNGNEATPSRSPDGTPCTGDTECATNHCVDGVCCNSACSGQCAACDLAGRVGECTATSGAPRGSRASCGSSGSAACQPTCDGHDESSCHSIAGTPCGAAGCSNGQQFGPSVCDSTGACLPSPSTMTCSAAGCSGTTCAVACADDAGCGPGGFCANIASGLGGCRAYARLLSVSLNPSRPSIAAPVTVTAQASGTAPQYRFTLADQAGKRHPCGLAFTASPTCTWDTHYEIPGATYSWFVEVVDAATVDPAHVPNDSQEILFVLGGQ